MATENDRRRRARRVGEERFDGGHGGQKPRAIVHAERRQHRRHRIPRLTLERPEGLPPGRGERDRGAATVARRRFAAHQPGGLEAAQHAAQIARIEAEIARKVGRGRALAVDEFVEKPGFRQRKPATGQMLVEYADPPRVEAVESPDGVDGRGRDGLH